VRKKVQFVFTCEVVYYMHSNYGKREGSILELFTEQCLLFTALGYVSTAFINGASFFVVSLLSVCLSIFIHTSISDK
jgi:hypothetical protein